MPSVYHLKNSLQPASLAANEEYWFVFLHRKKSKQILAYEIENNDLRKELYLLKNKAYNLRNFSTFAAILKILNPQCIAIVVRTPTGFQFLLGHFNSQEKLKTMLMQNSGVTNKSIMVCYGISGVVNNNMQSSLS